MNKFIVVFLLLGGCSEYTAFTASDCIARIEVQWGKESAREKAKGITQFMDSFVRHFVSDYGSEFPPPSSAVRGAKQQFIYLQYAGNCKRKIEITKSLTNKVLISVSDFPDVDVAADSYQSNHDTIMVKGPYWAGEKETKN